MYGWWAGFNPSNDASLRNFLFFQNSEVTHIKQFHPFSHPSQLPCVSIVLGESYYRPQPIYWKGFAFTHV